MTDLPLLLEEAQARLLSLAPGLPIEHVDVEGALGRYLAEPLLARRTQPDVRVSAMDGYAVRSDNRAGPWHVVGESAAGHPYCGHIEAGQAIRISTGAPLPDDAGTVILKEDVERRGDGIALCAQASYAPGAHIRPRGMDFVKDNEVLPAGLRIGATQTALAIASGHRFLPVRRIPRVAIIDSGDELAADIEHCTPHQMPASNGAMLSALVRALPVETRRLGPVPDGIDAIVAALEEAADVDLIVTSGGASVGDHDLIRPALERWGATIDFWRIAIKPGKPLLVATRENGARRQIIVGLPGNPASSYVTGYLFLMPLLRAMLGAATPLPKPVATRLAAALPPGGRRREFLRANWDGECVTALPLQDSGALSSLSRANALIDRPAMAPAADTDDTARIFLLDNGGNS